MMMTKYTIITDHTPASALAWIREQERKNVPEGWEQMKCIAGYPSTQDNESALEIATMPASSR